MAFTAMTLPKQMRFKPPKAADWFAEYAWVAFPESNMPVQTSGNEGGADQAPTVSKENRQMNAAKTTKSNIKHKRAGSASKSVKFDQDLD